MFISNRLSALDQFVFFGVLLVVCIYFFWIGHYSHQFPISEDVLSTVKPLLAFYSESGWAQKYQALTFQHAEHRLISTRIAAILSIQLFDYINIRFLYFIGGFFVLAIIFLIVWQQWKTDTAHPVDLLVYSFLLLNPAYRTGSFAAWGISNFASLLLPFLAIYFLHRKGWPNFFIFLILMFLSLNTQGNGLLLIPIGIFYVLRHKGHQYIKKLTGLLIFSSLICFIYAQGFSDEGYLARGYRYFHDHSLEVILFYLLAVIVWVGQWVIIPEQVMHQYQYPGVVLSLAVGSLILLVGLWSAWKLRKNLDERYSIRIYMLFYVLATILGAAWNRSLIATSLNQSSNLQDLWFVLDTRYTFYSLCLLVLILSLLASLYRAEWKHNGETFPLVRRHAVLTLLLALAFCLARYQEAIPAMTKERLTQERCIERWSQGQQPKNCLWHGETGQVMGIAIERGLLKVGP